MENAQVPLDDVLAYFRQYDVESYDVAACQGNEPTDADVAAFEATVGFRLPEDFRQFTISPMGGVYMAVREELWPRPKANDAGPFWSFLYALTVFGIASDIPEFLDIRKQYKKFRSEGPPGLVPFFRCLGDADRYCFDRDGRIIEWHHDEPDQREVLDMTFCDFLLREVHALEDRKERKLRGEDKAPQ